MRWSKGPYSQLLLLSDSTDTKDEADDNDDKRYRQEQVTLSEDKKRSNPGQHQYKNYQKELHLCLLWSGNAVARVSLGG